jgi:hypothetical protein
VYHAYRLRVLGSCRWYRGTVTSVRHEDDGDYHVDVAPDAGFAPFLDADNYSQQGGSLVTEIMPGQRFPIPNVGDHVGMFGTWVLDTDHGWNEIHPIWAIQYGGGSLVQSLPVVPPVYGDEGGSASGGSATGSSAGGGPNCTPGYSPCLPLGPSDYDCYGGGGDGPAYTKPGVVYRVTGSDPYRLDGNGNGLGCE